VVSPPLQENTRLFNAGIRDPGPLKNRGLDGLDAQGFLKTPKCGLETIAFEFWG
jgi:hypothetical protein